MNTDKENITGLEKSLIYIRNLDSCPPSYLNDPIRKEFFEIVWLQNEMPLHFIPKDDFSDKSDWLYLIPPYRVHLLNKAGKKGYLISFKRDLLDEADKEFFLDLFKIFNVQGEFSSIHLNTNDANNLKKVYALLEDEYLTDKTNYPIIKSLLKVFLLKLMNIKEQVFTTQDIHQKRVYEFLLLLESNYQTVRNIDFYAGKLGLSSKRLNQILKEKLDKTGTQLIHDRVILEAKKLIIHSESTIKEISFELGFSDRPYFSRFFKKQTGKTPEEFQKLVKNHIDIHANTLIAE